MRVAFVLLMIASPLLIAGVAFAIYKAVYSRKIKKRLAEGEGANIKPMMSPVRFVTTTLLIIIGGLILLWLIIIIISGIQTENLKKNMAVSPSVSWLNYDMIDDSPFSGYKFGEEIKGYYLELIDEENITFAVYMADMRFTKMLPPVMIAVNYTGDKELADDIATVKFPTHSSGRIGYYLYNHHRTEPDTLIAVNTGGYKGRFTFEYEVYYDHPDYPDVITESVPEPDEKSKIVFEIDEYGAVTIPKLQEARTTA